MTYAANHIARDLLYVNTRPCLFFIRQWDETIKANTAAEEEAKKLCLTTVSLEMANSLRRELESRVEQTGDAVKSSYFQEWLSLTYNKLRSCSTANFFVDPTILAAGILSHLLQYILENNRLNLGKRPVSYVPMDFIRDWEEEIKEVATDYDKMSKLLKVFLGLQIGTT